MTDYLSGFLLISSNIKSIDFENLYQSKEEVLINDKLSLYISDSKNIQINGTIQNDSPTLTKIINSQREFSISGSYLSLGPIYYVDRGKGVEAVSSDPALLAALFNVELDVHALFQDIAIGFRLGKFTLFKNVHKLEANYKLILKDGLIKVEVIDHAAISFSLAEEEMLDILPKKIANNLDSGYCVELTGGIDSRLVVALGLAGGSKPNLNFTIGDPSNGDVQSAQLISQYLKSPHICISETINSNHLVNDGESFVESSGFSVNAASYSWLSNSLKQLDGMRRGQITGAGGECAGDFYFTPFDDFISNNSILNIWIKKRLYLTGNDFVLGLRDYKFHHKLLKDNLMQSVENSNKEQWRDAMLKLYSEHRVKNWVGPVLTASSNYYDVAAPFLSKEYLNWALKIPNNNRSGRNPQLNLINKLDPKLASIPYANKFSGEEICSHYINLLNKVYRRITSNKKLNDLGSTSVIKHLISEKDIRNGVIEIMRESLGFNELEIESKLIDPDMYTSQLGSIVTAYWAKRKVNHYSALFDKSSNNEV